MICCRFTTGFVMGLRELLIPQDKIFFDMFEKQAGVVKEAAWQLVAL